ncbi:hypothetical protein EDD69_10687 [Thermolongibacillus altinsuensis]|jgi:hypothetical protein|uniref:Uncharacterized protein n=1 Tax=Thermolongibacillus altinsuensis TaxID=575256 RepID=A0A4R1QGI1_9BACL|nr:DUF3930 family protein [Thermolongibacillus altinsuensis]TCL49735.1 hypothetical protein EDD69_10687 [Thermolongibacillus altinsuensis]GMB08322.1 hypothetical protein B1no1_10320 [Thermolongibacillus altinsuensis]
MNENEQIDVWMETVTNRLFTIIVFFGIPYFLYVFVQFLNL